MSDAPPIRLAVVGAHLRGQPLHHQLTDLDATFVAETTTAPCYRLYALDTTPPKPGLRRVAEGDPAGAAVAVEVYELTAEAFGRFVDAIPEPLGICRVRLADGTDVAGFGCEEIGWLDATEITSFGGWRAYRSAAAPPG